MSRIIPFTDPLQGSAKVAHEVAHLGNYALPVISDDEIKEIRANGGDLSARQMSYLSGRSWAQEKRKCSSGDYANCYKVKGNGGPQWRIPMQSALNGLKPDVREWFLSKISGVSSPSDDDLRRRDEAFNKRSAQRDYNLEPAFQRNAIVKLYLSFIHTGRGSIISRKQEFCDLFERGAFLEMEDIRREISSVHWKTIDRWITVLDAAGGDVYALATSYGKNRGKSSVPGWVADVLLRFALHPNRFVLAEVARLTRLELERKGLSLSVSDATMMRWVKRHRLENEHLYTLCRDGKKVLNDKILPFLRRSYGGLHVGDVLVSDGHTINSDIINPHTGKPKRLTLILVSDMRSGMPLGWEFSDTENTAAIAAAYERAVRKLGFVPRVMYTDNGRAARSKFFNHDDGLEKLSGFFDRLKPYGYMESVFALPYNGQSKPIERDFRDLHEFEKLLISYRGNSIENKVARLSRNEKFAKGLHERFTGGVTPDVYEAHSRLSAWFSEWVMRETDKASRFGGRSRFDLYQEGLAEVMALPGHSDRVIAPESLRYLMMIGKKASITQNGIKLFGAEYWHESLYGYKAQGKQFLVRYDIQDLRSIYVFDETGEEFLCEASSDVWSGHHPMARLLGSKEDLQRLDDSLSRKGACTGATIRMAEGFFDAAEYNMPVPVKAIQTAVKIAEAKTGTDGGELGESERERMRRRLTAANLAQLDAMDEF